VEKLKLKYETICKAIKTLNKSLTKLKEDRFDDYEELRDSIIQRFEYSVDTFWKYLNEYLKEKEGIKIAAPRPKSVFRECLEIGLISKEEYSFGVDIIDDRNETSHGYNEELAEEIAHNIPHHYEVMNKILERVKPNNMQKKYKGGFNDKKF
jgi:nucleotidyltransferase substrate binding protein (TIGR01987 family)